MALKSTTTNYAGATKLDSHFSGCPRADMMRYYPEINLPATGDYFSVAQDSAGVYHIVTRRITHRVVSRPHQCNKTCTHAKGTSCDCVCGGEFHGIYADAR